MNRSRNLKRIALSLVAALLGAVTPTLSADYLAYAVTKDGEIPLPQTLDEAARTSAKKLVRFRWGDYAGPKARVSVLAVENETQTASFVVNGPNGATTWSYSYTDMQRHVPVHGIDSMLADALLQSHRFAVVERAELGEVLYEQDLADEGRISRPSAAKKGNLLGAEYLIKAVVTHYEPNFKGRSIGVGALIPGARKVGLGGAKLGRKKSMVGLNFRLIDAETRQVVFSKQVEVILKKTSFVGGGAAWGYGGAFGGLFESFSKTPIGQAILAGINIGVYELAKQVGNRPMEGAVVALQGSDVILNLGRGVVEVGEILNARSLGEELIDPDTGLSLGSDDETLGSLRVVRVAEKRSYARAIDFDAAALKRGDRVRSSRPAAAPRFGPRWGKKGLAKLRKG